MTDVCPRLLLQEPARDRAARNPRRFRYYAGMESRLGSAEVFTPTTGDELARFMRENAAGARRPLFPVGGRTALHYGYPWPEDAVTIATSELTRIVDYPARDMTITVEAGLRVEELQQRLGDAGQRLPIDIPQAHRATIGGAIATNTSGPGRFAHGTLRDYVIGISAVDGQGRLFSGGGRVVKNVAGYDLCKLLVGSLGTLAIITQVTLKLRPQAAARRYLWLGFRHLAPIDHALGRLLTSQTRPDAIEVLNPRAARQIQRESKLELPIDRTVLCLAFEGSEAEVAWQITQAAEELTGFSPDEFVSVAVEDSRVLADALTEYQAASDDPLTIQANLPPSRAMSFVEQATEVGVAVQCHAGNGVVVGHLPDRCSTVEEAEAVLISLRKRAETHGGSLVVLGCDDDWKSRLSVFGPALPSVALAVSVKEALDPHNLLSPGRLRGSS